MLVYLFSEAQQKFGLNTSKCHLNDGGNSVTHRRSTHLSSKVLSQQWALCYGQSRNLGWIRQSVTRMMVAVKLMVIRCPEHWTMEEFKTECRWGNLHNKSSTRLLFKTCSLKIKKPIFKTKTLMFRLRPIPGI